MTIVFTLIVRFNVKVFKTRVKILGTYSILLGVALLFLGVSGEWAASDALGMFAYAIFIEGLIKLLATFKNIFSSSKNKD